MAERLFLGETPTNLDLSDGVAYSLATYVVPQVAGSITHILWYFPTTVQGTAVQGAVFNVATGALISGTAVTFPAPGTPGAWNEVALSTPVALSAGTEYAVTIWTSGRYVNTGAYAWPKVGTSLATNLNSGRFAETVAPPPVRPTVGFNSGNYYVDLWFEPAGSGATKTATTVVATAAIALPTTLGSSVTKTPATVTASAAVATPTAGTITPATRSPATVVAAAAIATPIAGLERTITTAGTTATVTGLSTARQYSARVRAYDAAGNFSAWSAPILFTTAGSGTVSPAVVAATAAIATPTVGGAPPTVAAGRARPVVRGQGVLLDVAATPPGGQSISGYSWQIISGGGSLTNSTTATPTYTAPGTGSGVVTVRATVSATNGGSATADVTVSYHATIVAAENALTGTARATWDLASPNLGGITTLQGFLDGFSVDKNGTANFKIGQSDGAGWTAEVYRLGYYGGNGARSYGTLTPTGPQLTASQAQPTPGDADANTTRLSADAGNWSTTLTWTPPAWAPSGIYILRLNRTGGGASHIVFILRDDARTADLMFMPADSTWQAYNAWGGLGSNMYTGNSLYYGINVDQYHNDAARFVSYNRPIVNRGAADSGRDYGAVEWSTFFTGEYPMLRFVERNGIDVKYYGCIDAAGDSTGTHLRGNGSTRGAVKAGIFVGHNEYWSDGMRSGWETARDNGVSVFSCAGNEVFWRLVGIDSDSDGRPRTWECYKSTIASRGSTSRPNWTGTWRDPDGTGKGGNNPENTFTGTIFVVNGPDLRSIVVPFAGGYSAQPLWRNTSVAALTTGQSYTSGNQILGFEWDTYGPAGVDSAGAAFLAAPHPRVKFCSNVTYAVSSVLLADAGDVYTSGNATHRLVVYPGGNNALVFGTGTINWSFGVDNANTYQTGTDNESLIIQQATVNMFTDMGAPPYSLMSGLTATTPQTWFEVIPTTVAATTAIPTPGTAFGAGKTPATVTATAAIATPAITTGATRAPATVAGTAAIATPAVAAGTVKTPVTVVTTAAIGAPSIQRDTTRAPATVTATAAIATPVVSKHADLTPATVAAISTIATPAIRLAVALADGVVAAAALGVPEAVFTTGITLGDGVAVDADLDDPTVAQVGTLLVADGPGLAVAVGEPVAVWRATVLPTGLPLPVFTGGVSTLDSTELRAGRHYITVSTASVAAARTDGN
jgi:N,N-dimethylformamidase beta subunit-like protein